MAAPLATPEDVQYELDTQLGTTEIQPLLDRFVRDIQRAYDASDFEDEQHQIDLEAAYTALQIATRHDRAEASMQTGRTSVEYEASVIAELRGRVRSLEPGDELGSGTVIRNTDRHVRAASSEAIE